jgi:uncharacterized damage-inducible protein DinB
MLSPIQFASRAFGCCLLAAASTVVFAQAAAPAKPAGGIEKEFVDAAEAMPEDKYNFAPPASAGEFKGVRTFGEQVKHVAEVNAYFFHDPDKSLVDTRADFEKLKTKAEIVKALKDSFVQAHAYVAGITPQNVFVMTANGTRGGMSAFGIAHMMDHYGQMVEYLRMNGIVPPASRGGM